MNNMNCKAPDRSLGRLFALLRRAYSEWRNGIDVAAAGIGDDAMMCKCLTAYPDGRIEWHDDALRDRLRREMLADGRKGDDSDGCFPSS